MAREPQMKVKATMDNSDLKKKSKESQDAIRSFERTSTDALGKIGEAFGINVGEVEKMTSSIRGLGEKLKESGSVGGQALGKLLSGVNGLKAGFAALGIGAVVAGFKALKEEAENFKTTLAGANFEMATAAYIDTYRQVIHDFNRSIGEGAAEAESKWNKFWGTFGAKAKAYVTTGAFMAGSVPQVPGADMDYLGKFLSLTSEAEEKAETADQLTRDILNKMDEISTKSVEWAKWEREIAEYKRIAYDKTVSTAEQQKAIVKAEELIVKRYKEEADARSQIATWTVKLNALASSSREALHKENELRKEADRIAAQMEDKLRELQERRISIALQAQKEADAMKEALAAEEAIAKSREALKDWRIEAKVEVPDIEVPPVKTDLDVTMPDLTVPPLEAKVEVPDIEQLLPKIVIPATVEPGLAPIPRDIVAEWTAEYGDVLSMGIGALKVTVKPELDETGIIDITNELQSMMQSAFEGVGASIGQLIGDLATGGDAWSNFATNAVSALGDMAVQVGRIAIQAGVAMLGIKAALNFAGGEWAAIAAGTALVALGAAVKAGLSNVASGGSYSSSVNVATAGGYGSSTLGSDFETRSIDVEVHGTLRASGNELMTVIENESKRRNHTT